MAEASVVKTFSLLSNPSGAPGSRFFLQDDNKVIAPKAITRYRYIKVKY
jgi:hypothetical protein